MSLINVLLIDDDEEDFLLTEGIFLQLKNRHYNLEWANSFEDGKRILLENKHDVCLVDYRIGNLFGPDLIREVVRNNCDTPLILLTGLKNEKIDREAQNAGAADYLSKSELTAENLDRSIRYSISHAKNLSHIKHLNAELENRVAMRTEALAKANKELAISKQELTLALAKEIELNELKTRFVTTASHEFRTPLATILSSTSIIARYHSEEDNEKKDKHIKRIKSAILNLNEILNEFLSVEKLEKGLVKDFPEEIDIYEFVESVIDEMKAIASKTQQIHFEFKGNCSSVYLDSRMLKNVIINLLSNAIKYSPKDKDIEIEVDSNEKELRIKVHDKGIGIPTKDQGLIFKRFFRAQNSVDIQGTGLGLSITKKYIDLMGGSINFISEPGIGTTFSVKFPVRSKF